MILSTIFLLASIPANAEYNPDSRLHSRIIIHQYGIVSSQLNSTSPHRFTNFNLSRFSYVGFNVTLEYWNPNAVAVKVGGNNDDIMALVDRIRYDPPPTLPSNLTFTESRFFLGSSYDF